MLINIISAKKRSCPKCNGSLAYGRDWAGEYLTCLMCGAMNDLELTRQEGGAKPDQDLNHFHQARTRARELTIMTQRPIRATA